MLVWFGILFVVYILATISRLSNNQQVYKVISINFLAYFLCGIVLVLISGLRYKLGDTTVYRYIFDNIPLNLKDYISGINFSDEWGFTLILYLIKSIINNSQAMIFIFSMFTLILFCRVFYKESKLYELAIFIFITSGCFITSMNGMRQYFVSAVVFSLMPIIYKKRLFLFILIILVLSTIHSSVIVLIPIYFILNKPAWKKADKLLIFLGLLIFALYSLLGKYIVFLLLNTPYSEYGDIVLFGGDYAQEANIVRMLVTVVPLILSYLSKETLLYKEKYYSIANTMAILNMIFMLLATSKTWLFARFCIYFSPFSILLIVWSIKYSRSQQRTILYLMCILLYTIYFYYEMNITTKTIYTSIYLPF